jgi:hypothetical protein
MPAEGKQLLGKCVGENCVHSFPDPTLGKAEMWNPFLMWGNTYNIFCYSEWHGDHERDHQQKGPTE